MKRYILQLRIAERVEIPEECNGRDAYVTTKLKNLIDQDEIEYLGFHFDDGSDIDNHDDGQPVIGQTETFFEVRGVFDEIEFTEPVDVLQQVRVALNAFDAAVTNFYEREETPFIKTVIEITLQ